ncbi:MAG TPA: hypothetical protein GXX51_12490 [Firmicutes bacterium]|nr:hypothetical protein [Bacillota bacterium]
MSTRNAGYAILVDRITGRWAGDVTDDKIYVLRYDAGEVLAVESAVSDLSFLPAGSGIIAGGLLVCRVFYVRRDGALGFEEHELPLSVLLPPAAGGRPAPPGSFVEAGAIDMETGTIKGDAEVARVNFTFDPKTREIYQRTCLHFEIYLLEEAAVTIPFPGRAPGGPPGGLERYPIRCSIMAMAQHSIMARRSLGETRAPGKVEAIIHLDNRSKTIESVSASVTGLSFEMAGEGIMTSGLVSLSVLYVDEGNVKRHKLQDNIEFGFIVPLPPGAGHPRRQLTPGTGTSSGPGSNSETGWPAHQEAAREAWENWETCEACNGGCLDLECEGCVDVTDVSWRVNHDDSRLDVLDVQVELDVRVRALERVRIDLPARATGGNAIRDIEGDTVDAMVDVVKAEVSEEHIHRVEVNLKHKCIRLTNVAAEVKDIRAEVMFDEVLVRGSLRIGFYYVGRVDRVDQDGVDQDTMGARVQQRTMGSGVEYYEEITREFTRFVTAGGARPGMHARACVTATRVDSRYDPGGSKVWETLSLRISVIVTEHRELALIMAPHEAVGEPGTGGGAGRELASQRVSGLFRLVRGIARFPGRIYRACNRRNPGGIE